MSIFSIKNIYAIIESGAKLKLTGESSTTLFEGAVINSGGTNEFSGNTTFNGVTTFTGKYENTGMSVVTNNITFNQTYDSTSTLNIKDGTTHLWHTFVKVFGFAFRVLSPV